MLINDPVLFRYRIFISMMSLMTINWNTVDATPHSTCSHGPFSLHRWKALKPIIVFLEGRLLAWTLWHTFKASDHNIFRPESVALALKDTIPQSHTHTHTHISSRSFSEEQVNICELHCSLELFFLYQRGNWWVWQGTSKGQHKIPTASTFPVYLNRTLWTSLKTKTPHHVGNSKQVFVPPKLSLT